MREVISPKDYYDEKGILLIAKGSSIPLNLLIQVKNRYNDCFSKDTSIEHHKCIKQALEHNQCYKKVGLHTLNKASSILITTIFESKQKPWWMHICALGSYINWLYTHSIDVALISLMIAIESGFSEDILIDISLGSLLHDVGKLLIPKEILQKTTALCAEERAIIRQHCELGCDCLSGCSISETSRDIILQHHERLNGSGYPNQLQDAFISEGAKIVMIADAFDAITAGRPYRKSKSIRDALTILQSANTEYSEAYLNILRAILKEG